MVNRNTGGWRIGREMNRNELAKSALMVIDMQRYFLEPGATAYLAPPRRLVPNALRLTRAFRAAGRPIAFTRHAHQRGDAAGQMERWWRGRLPRIGESGSELIPEIVPGSGELLLTKQRYSAFEGTGLVRWLARRDVEAVVICGVMTNLCVETTARHAFLKELQPIIVRDACASSKRKFHEASLTNLEYGFAYITTTRDVVCALEGVR